MKKISDELVRKLMDAGLSRAQANSTTAEVCAELFMPEDSKLLVYEAQMRVKELDQRHYDLMKKINSMDATLAAIAEAKDEYGTITDDKARLAVALYGALLKVSEKNGVTGEQAVDAASYIVYAFFGGQARQR